MPWTAWDVLCADPTMKKDTELLAYQRPCTYAYFDDTGLEVWRLSYNS